MLNGHDLLFAVAGEVVMITVAFLIILFSLQRFGTSKVGLVVGPALFIWFCCLAGIGVYNIRTYGPEVLHAFNPVYIYYYFERNPTQAWMSLGGCLLCATGVCFWTMFGTACNVLLNAKRKKNFLFHNSALVGWTVYIQ
jgi:K+ transporter